MEGGDQALVGCCGAVLGARQSERTAARRFASGTLSDDPQRPLRFSGLSALPRGLNLALFALDLLRFSLPSLYLIRAKRDQIFF